MPTIKEIKRIAQERNVILPPKIKKSDMVHILQEQEGNNPCYAKNDCSASGCLWFKDCQKEYERFKSRG